MAFIAGCYEIRILFHAMHEFGKRKRDVKDYVME
jgi:hypothetical protein